MLHQTTVILLDYPGHQPPWPLITTYYYYYYYLIKTLKGHNKRVNIFVQVSKNQLSWPQVRNVRHLHSASQLRHFLCGLHVSTGAFLSTSCVHSQFLFEHCMLHTDPLNILRKLGYFPKVLFSISKYSLIAATVSKRSVSLFRAIIFPLYTKWPYMLVHKIITRTNHAVSHVFYLIFSCEMYVYLMFKILLFLLFKLFST